MRSKAPRKILFISMPFTDLTLKGAQKHLFDTRAIVNIPYGLLSICTYVRKYSKHEVEFKIININDQLVTEYRNNNIINDPQQYFNNFVEEEVKKYNPDIVGISIMFNVNYKFLDPITERIKKISPETLIIVGGNLATVIYGEIASKENVDALCYGEGEIPWLQLTESENIRAHIQESNIFVTKESIKAGLKPVNRLVAELDSIPPIDFSQVNLSNFNLPKQRGTVYKKDFNLKMVSRIIYVSRGCPYNCNFCAGFNMHGKKVRFLSIKRVINDVKKMIENDGLTELFVCDDAFLIDKTRAKTILKEFVKMKINVNFPAILMRNIDDEIAGLLSLLGNTFQYTSMESGSDYVLKHIIQKPISKTESKKAVSSLKKYGISVLTNIVVGSPGETDEHRKETLETLYDIGFSWVFIMIALPVPGSRLYAQCKEKGYIVNEDFFSPNLTKCNIKTLDYSPEHIEWQAYMMNLYTNFVHNYNLRMGNYDECIICFNNVIKSYPGHAFAYYCLMKAYAGKGEKGLAVENRHKFDELVNTSAYWKDWAKYFGLLQRACPVCQNTANPEILHTQKFVLPDNHILPREYDLTACGKCGFVYADTPAVQDIYDKYYAQMSKYEMAYISDDTSLYAERAAWINNLIDDKNAGIIDVGCGNGQLLMELKKIGFSNLTALDPSQKNIESVQSRGITGILSSIFDVSPARQYDCVILSGVLEHIRDVYRVMQTMKLLVKTNGLLFVFVPDASRYQDYDTVPFDYFNVEHLNHFDEISLINLGFSHGMSVIRLLKTEISVSSVSQPVIFCAYQNDDKKEAYRQNHSKKAVLGYIKKTSANQKINRVIDDLVSNNSEIIVWGAGNFTSRLLASTNLAKCNIACFVDNDAHKQGTAINGISVCAPSVISGMEKPPTIVISAIFQNEIIAEIKNMGLNNRVVVLCQ